MIIADVRQAIVDALRPALPGWNVTGYLAGQKNPPCVEVFLDPDEPIVFDRAGSRGADDYQLVIRCISVRTLDQAAQELLDDLLTPGSPRFLKGLVEAADFSDDVTVHVRSCDFREFVGEGWPSGAFGLVFHVLVAATY